MSRVVVLPQNYEELSPTELNAIVPICIAALDSSQAGASQPPGAGGASELAGAPMSAFADIVFCRAKSALQNRVKAETPSLSLRLSARASDAKTRTTPGSTPDMTRPPSAIVHGSSASRPCLVPLLSGCHFQHASL
jgi:hypothetical protein